MRIIPSGVQPTNMDVAIPRVFTMVLENKFAGVDKVGEIAVSGMISGAHDLAKDSAALVQRVMVLHFEVKEKTCGCHTLLFAVGVDTPGLDLAGFVTSQCLQQVDRIFPRWDCVVVPALLDHNDAVVLNVLASNVLRVTMNYEVLCTYPICPVSVQVLSELCIFKLAAYI